MAFRPRILVVDDERQMLQLLKELLTQMGAEPCCVDSSREAAEWINREKFDGIFLDWFASPSTSATSAWRAFLAASSDKGSLAAPCKELMGGVSPQVELYCAPTPASTPSCGG